MAKVSGFLYNYTGLSNNEAWTKVYEIGKNLMPIKDKRIQKIYNGMFKKKTRVIRENKIKSINTDVIVPGDIVILERGEFVPADVQILEAKELNFENNILMDNKDVAIEKEVYVPGVTVYQGMKVKSGRVIAQVQKTGVNTFLGSKIRQIDDEEKSEGKKFYRYFIIWGVICFIAFLFGGISGFFISNDAGFARVEYALYSAVAVFITVIPVGLIVALRSKIFKEQKELKKVNITLKNICAAFDINKIKVLCVDDKFLTKNYENCIRYFYKAGIRIVVFSEKGQLVAMETAKDAGLFLEKDCDISGEEVDKLTPDELIPIICQKTVFYSMNHEQKAKIIKEFENVKIHTMSLGNGLEDLMISKKSLINISANEVKKSADREFAKALISGSNFSSVFIFARSCFVINKYLKTYLLVSMLFHLPIVILIIIALFSGINLKNYILPIALSIFAVLPLIMLLIDKKYEEDELFDKNFKKTPKVKEKINKSKTVLKEQDVGKTKEKSGTEIATEKGRTKVKEETKAKKNNPQKHKKEKEDIGNMQL